MANNPWGMTRERAVQLIGTYWGFPGIVPGCVADEIEAVSLPGESLLATLSRVGEVPVIMRVPPFHHMAILSVVAEAEVRMARERKGLRP